MKSAYAVLGAILTLAACGQTAAPTTAQGESPGAGDTKAAEAAKPGDTKADTAAPPVASGAKATVGQPAPDFTLNDSEGAPFQLSAHAGKLVVLEWFNPGCPFVQYAHGQGPLEDMATTETAAGVVWVAINSGAPGKQGAGADASRDGAKQFGMTHPVLVDESGAVGHAYGAEKTPHVFLVDATGVLVYAGAIDNAPIGEVDGEGAYVNHLATALAEVRAQRAVGIPQTKSYGCSVKYAKG